MNIWRDYMGGTIEREGQRLWFYGENSDGLLICCFRAWHWIKGKPPIPYGPGYSSLYADVPTIPEEEFAAWDANWKKRM